MNQDRKTPLDTESTLRKIVDSSLVVAATTGVVVFLGTVYLQGIYGAFNLEFWSFDVPMYAVELFSFFALVQLLVNLSLPFAVLIVLTLIKNLIRLKFPNFFESFRSERVKNNHQRTPTESLALAVGQQSLTYFKWYIYIAIALAVSILGINSVSRAGRDIGNGVKGVPVYVVLREPEKHHFDDQLVTANAKGTLRLLAQTKDIIVLFTNRQTLNAPRSTFVMKRDDLVSIRFTK